MPGSARVFRCLAEKMGDLDFGEPCRQEVVKKLQRRWAGWPHGLAVGSGSELA